jgi:hypothetical protein
MNNKECDPKSYVTWDEHERYCDSRMDTIHESKKVSEQDRKALRKDISNLESDIVRLEGFKDKLLWVIIMAALGIISTNIIGPQLSKNMEVSELKGYIAELAGTVKDQQSLIETGNKLSQENQERLKSMERRPGNGR